MSTARLQVDHAACLVAAKASVNAQAAPPLPHPLPTVGVNAFDAVGALLLAWAGSTHQGLSAAVRARGGILGECSTSAFMTVADMDDENAGGLRLEES